MVVKCWNFLVDSDVHSEKYEGGCTEFREEGGGLFAKNNVAGAVSYDEDLDDSDVHLDANIENVAMVF